MAISFNNLGNIGDEDAFSDEERQLFAMDQASEQNERGKPMQTSEATAGQAIMETTATASQGNELAAPAADEGGDAVPSSEGATTETGSAGDAPGADTVEAAQAAANAAAGEPSAKESSQPDELIDDKDEKKVAATGAASAIDPQPEDVKPTVNDFSALLQYAAGKVTADKVDVRPDRAAVRVSSLSALQRTDDEPVSDDLADLAQAIQTSVTGAVLTPPAVPKLPPGAAPEGRTGAPFGAQPGATSGGMVAAPAGLPQVATTVGNQLGRAAAGVIATPFLALSSAARHLNQRFALDKKPAQSALPSGPASASQSMLASTGRPLQPGIINTMERITGWKCDRIVNAASDVENAALALQSTAEYAVWEDAVRKTASERNESPEAIVGRLRSDPELDQLRTGMDGVWHMHPEKVKAYRMACDDFERNVRGVVKEFANSDDQIKERITSAMKGVEERSKLLPGFGENVGEYQRTLAESIRELAKTIAEFVQNLVSKLTGKLPANNEQSM